MSANKKKRRLPEEDLEAAVADIINSPITRSNLSFLRPQVVETQPLGDEPQATVVGVHIAGDSGLSPRGCEPEPLPWRPLNPTRALWQAEGLGTFFEQKRVRPIQQAHDALSAVERKVYDLLWGAGNQDSEDFRLVHCSLQRISVEARINIKTVRELIPRLIEKGFLQIEHEADVRRNTPTLYRVSSYAVASADQKRRNRRYVTKTGKGIVYVHAVSASVGEAAFDDRSFDTGPRGLESTPSEAVITPLMAALGTSIKQAFGAEPSGVFLQELIDACQQNSLQTTGERAVDEELLYFTSTKAAALSRAPNIRNHLTVLRRAVPECFLGDGFRAYRAANAGRR